MGSMSKSGGGGTIDLEMSRVGREEEEQREMFGRGGGHGGFEGRGAGGMGIGMGGEQFAQSEVRGNASDVGADDNSEKAIWQTRTVTVEYGK
jgi:hypothetical protein